MDFAFKAPPLGTACGFRCFARHPNDPRGADQFRQPVQGFRPIHGLATVLLRLDDDQAVIGHAMIAQIQQLRLVVFRQRRRRDIEAQVDRAGGLVDVLPARALRAHGADLDLGLRNAEPFCNLQHDPLVKQSL